MASFSVVTNLASVNAQSNLFSTNIGLRQALTRVSSGFRINYSGDDAAGLAVANSFRSEVAVLNQGVRNANDGLSNLQIKDGALDNISKLLDRLSTLATAAASGQTSTASRTTLNAEFTDVISEITREATVAGLTAAAGFSVFVSNNGANGVVAGNVGAADATALAHQRDDHRDPGHRGDGGDDGGHGHHDARRGAGPGRYSSRTACPTPSTWRSRRSSTPARPRAASATPTSRRSRRT